METAKYCLLLILSFLFLNSCENGIQKDISTVVPITHYHADELIEDLKNDRNFPKEGVVSVRGFIKETNTKNDKFNILMRGNSDQNHYIICEMGASFEASDVVLSKGNPIAIKGVLKGYLNDVVLLNCVMENTLENE